MRERRWMDLRSQPSREKSSSAEWYGRPGSTKKGLPRKGHSPRPTGRHDSLRFPDSHHENLFSFFTAKKLFIKCYDSSANDREFFSITSRFNYFFFLFRSAWIEPEELVRSEVSLPLGQPPQTGLNQSLFRLIAITAVSDTFFELRETMYPLIHLHMHTYNWT